MGLDAHKQAEAADVGFDAHKQAEVQSRTEAFMAAEASKPFGWGALHALEWATIEAMLEAVDLPHGASLIDVGCGSGWTSLFLTESGYAVTGYDIVPANIELCRRRAEHWQSAARFEVADMERLPPGEPADAALVLEALHHSADQTGALRSIARRVRPGGWLLVGEPSWLHRFSPGARAMRRERGWMERGVSLRTLRRDLRAAGFGHVRRFHQPTLPYERGARGFAWQLIRLAAANAWVAPKALIWVAAQRDDRAPASIHSDAAGPPV